jgi:preprotein translocase subunit SecG
VLSGVYALIIITASSKASDEYRDGVSFQKMKFILMFVFVLASLLVEIIRKRKELQESITRTAPVPPQEGSA